WRRSEPVDSLSHVSRVRPDNQFRATQLQRPGIHVNRIADVRRSWSGEVRIIDRNFNDAVEPWRTIADRVTQRTCGIDLDRQAGWVGRSRTRRRRKWTAFSH